MEIDHTGVIDTIRTFIDQLPHIGEAGLFNLMVAVVFIYICIRFCKWILMVLGIVFIYLAITVYLPTFSVQDKQSSSSYSNNI